ncbi:adenosylcobinamide-phosphate synthase [Jatrophihabitans sp. GAS493]|uniref:cobalamin biosynthesis protein n=1 Tax=Jatrophihabitans sp. GAS493 TaxID=1907575 RepID=UPI000BB8CCA0|nr:cobalamin biosynthesis protein [Jatrophihabitans sp. GAS493]SOD74487.1 adenosylcobinamide-phosphate synthase [Jatrophihabitans sp. GAS493]
MKAAVAAGPKAAIAAGPKAAIAAVLPIVGAVALDAVLADPARWHPVAGFGRMAAAAELSLYGDTRAAGVRFVALNVGPPIAAGVLVERLLRGRPAVRGLLLAAVTWTTLGGTSLIREGQRMAELLDGGDLDAARGRLGYLCARSSDGLNSAELSRATVESLAENTSDAVVAPLFWAALGGLPAVIGYRAVNTLDAMVGYRSERYQNFGWAAARLDDLANLLPARFTAVLTCVLAPTADGSVRSAWRVLRRDASHHPSPNAGHPEAAFAGALGVSLGGVNVYGDAVEDRGTLGDGPAPQIADIRRAARLSRRVALAAAGVLAAKSALLAARAAARSARPE